MLKMVLIL